MRINVHIHSPSLHCLLVFVLLFILLVNVPVKMVKTRAKRHLIFPMGGGIFKLIIGVGIPAKLGIKQSMALGMNFQFQYKLPSDIADLEKPYPPIVGRSRARRRTPALNSSNLITDRTLFYMGLEAAISSLPTDLPYSIHGRSLLATVTYRPHTDLRLRCTEPRCEFTAERSILVPAYWNKNIGNGRDCILRAICDNAMYSLGHPTNGLLGELIHIAFTPSSASGPEGDVYIEALHAGQFGVDCDSLYPDCPVDANLLDMLSVLDN